MAKKNKTKDTGFISRSDLGQPPRLERQLWGLSERRRLHPEEYGEVLGDDGYMTIVHTPKIDDGGLEEEKNIRSESPK